MADEEEVALFFASCMKDPARPTHCARVLCSCLQVLDGSESDEPYALYQPYLMPENEDYEDIRHIPEPAPLKQGDLGPRCLPQYVLMLTLVGQ